MTNSNLLGFITACSLKTYLHGFQSFTFIHIIFTPFSKLKSHYYIIDEGWWRQCIALSHLHNQRHRWIIAMPPPCTFCNCSWSQMIAVERPQFLLMHKAMNAHQRRTDARWALGGRWATRHTTWNERQFLLTWSCASLTRHTTSSEQKLYRFFKIVADHLEIFLKKCHLKQY